MSIIPARLKPFFEKVPRLQEGSIFIKQYPEPELVMPYHYHPEFEIALTQGRKSKRFVGNSVEEIDDQDLVFLGKNLPHCFIGEEEIPTGSNLVVLQFQFDVFGENFLSLPEAAAIKDLVNRSQYGILFPEHTQAAAKAKILEMLDAHPLERLIRLLELLHILSQVRDYRLLNTRSFQKQHYNEDYDRLNQVYDFIAQNFKESISLEEAAEVANLSKTAFCRYFKQRTAKTFKEVLNEMRISFACDLILNGRLQAMTVSQIAEESGFRNISNFNRQFRKVTGHSPAQYAREFWQRAAPLSA